MKPYLFVFGVENESRVEPAIPRRCFRNRGLAWAICVTPLFLGCGTPIPTPQGTAICYTQACKEEALARVRDHEEMLKQREEAKKKRSAEAAAAEETRRQEANRKAKEDLLRLVPCRWPTFHGLGFGNIVEAMALPMDGNNHYEDLVRRVGRFRCVLGECYGVVLGTGQEVEAISLWNTVQLNGQARPFIFTAVDMENQYGEGFQAHLLVEPRYLFCDAAR